jgi:hypothetical protein
MAHTARGVRGKVLPEMGESTLSVGVGRLSGRACVRRWNREWQRGKAARNPWDLTKRGSGWGARLVASSIGDCARVWFLGAALSS